LGLIERECVFYRECERERDEKRWGKERIERDHNKLLLFINFVCLLLSKASLIRRDTKNDV